MLGRSKRKRGEEPVEGPAPAQPERARHLQMEAETWRQLAQREVQVARLLRTCMVEQRAILTSWEGMDTQDDIAGETLALEGAFQGLVSRTVELIQHALMLEQQSLQEARAALQSYKRSTAQAAR